MPQLVRVGDYAKGTIYSISRETGYKLSDIIASNPGIDIHNLTADTIIKLPTPKKVFSAVNIDDYGSIYSISRETGVSVDDIIAANPGINVNSIPSGTSIKLPTSSAVMQNVNIDDYGTIYQIHKHTGVPVEDIVKANPDIDINHIPPHTNINVPSKSIPSKQTPKVTNPKPPTPTQEEYEKKVESKPDREIGNEPCEKCKEFIIVIDPGHGGTKKIGGSSPNNAISVSGILEKTLTLSLAKKIKTILNNKKIGKYKIKIILTRSTDVNKSLRYRRTLPNIKKAKLNLSLHFNGNNSASVHGVEIFSGSSASKHRSFATIILKYAHAEINKQYTTRSRGVKDGSHFGAIRNVTCPSALLEGEFITNKKASDYFSNDTNMKKFASAISKGLLKAMKDIYNVK